MNTCPVMWRETSARQNQAHPLGWKEIKEFIETAENNRHINNHVSSESRRCLRQNNPNRGPDAVSEKARYHSQNFRRDVYLPVTVMLLPSLELLPDAGDDT
jgi:hypothetical protein